MNYWLITTSLENFRADKKISGFTVQGLKERHKRTVMKFQPGDKVVYYIGVCIILNLVSAFLSLWKPVKLSGLSSTKP